MEFIKNKKAQTGFGEMLFALAIIFGAAIFFVILFNVYNNHIKDSLNTGLTTSTPAEAGKNVTELLDDVGSSVGIFDTLFPLLIVGIFGFVLISAMFIKSHPAFFFIGIIVLAAVLVLAAIYSNVYESLTDTDEFASTDPEFNIMGVFLSNLPIVMLVIFIAIAVILWARSGGGTTRL